MLGCWRAARIWTSRSKRARCSAVSRAPSRSTRMATLRPVDAWMASQTTAWPPRLISRTIVYPLTVMGTGAAAGVGESDSDRVAPSSADGRAAGPCGGLGGQASVLMVPLAQRVIRAGSLRRRAGLTQGNSRQQTRGRAN